MSPNKVERMKRALMRSNTHLLLTAVMLFQFLAMLLIAFQRGGVNLQALGFAVALPLSTTEGALVKFCRRYHMALSGCRPVEMANLPPCSIYR